MEAISGFFRLRAGVGSMEVLNILLVILDATGYSGRSLMSEKLATAGRPVGSVSRQCLVYTRKLIVYRSKYPMALLSLLSHATFPIQHSTSKLICESPTTRKSNIVSHA